MLLCKVRIKHRLTTGRCQGGGEKKAKEMQEKTPTDNLAATFAPQVVKAEGEANSVNPAPVASDTVNKEGVKEVKEGEKAAG